MSRAIALDLSRANHLATTEDSTDLLILSRLIHTLVPRDKLGTQPSPRGFTSSQSNERLYCKWTSVTSFARSFARKPYLSRAKSSLPINNVIMYSIYYSDNKVIPYGNWKVDSQL